MNDLLATYWTVAGPGLPGAPDQASTIPLERRVKACAEAGYAGMGFNFDDAAAFRRRLDDRTIRSLFADHGLRWIELEVLTDWFADGERRARSDAMRRAAFEQAEALGAFQIKIAGDMESDWPLDRMAEAFARLCDEGARHGVRITIELFPVSNLPSIERGLAVVGAAGHPNGGLMFDIWHVVRGHIALADIAALAPGVVTGVELDDGLLSPEMPDMYEETIHCRRLPGEGEFDIAGLLRATRAAGFAGPYGVEILSHENRARSVEDAARLSCAAARRVVDAALAPRGA